MAKWYEYILPSAFIKNDELEKNTLLESISEEVVDGKHLLEDLAKEAKTYQLDPMDHSNAYMMQSMDYNDKKYYFEVESENVLNRQALENMSKHHIIGAIIGSRCNQIAEFAHPTDDEDLGYKIVLKDLEAEITDDDKKNIKALESFISNCGTNITDYELTFEAFLRQITRDSLIYDQCCFEIVKNRKGEITGFIPVDASTVRRAALSKEEIEIGRRSKDKHAYVQVLNNKIVAEFMQEDLCFGVRRPTSNIRTRGYGNSELQDLYQILHNLFNAETFNASNFTNGINTNGIIAIKSKMNPKLFRSFRREFYQMLNGVGNAKRTPLIQLDPEENESISSISLQSSNREMEYNNWINYLIKITCGIYQIDPAEIGFIFGTESQSSSLFGTDPSARVLMGKEKGLRPLIRSLQTWLNRYVIDQIDDRYRLVFTGLDSVSLMDKVKLEEHKMKYMTMNEIRVKHDLPEIDDGDIIAAYYDKIKNTVIKEEGVLVAEEFGDDDNEVGLEIAVEDKEEREDKDVSKESDVVSVDSEDKDMDKYMAELEKARSESIIPPQYIADNAQKALDAKEKYDLKDYGTPVGWKRARQLANREVISYDTVKRMYSFLKRHEKNAEIGKGKEYHEDKGAVMYDAWGGKEAIKWCEKIMNQQESKDK